MPKCVEHGYSVGNDPCEHLPPCSWCPRCQDQAALDAALAPRRRAFLEQASMAAMQGLLAYDTVEMWQARGAVKNMSEYAVECALALWAELEAVK